MATATKAVEAADVVADVKELVEDTAEFVEVQASWLIRNPKAVVLTAALGGLALGLSAGVFLAQKKLSAKYQKLADEQIADVKSRYTVERLIPEKPALDDLVEHAEAAAEVADIVRTSGYLHYDKAEQVVEAIEEQDEQITVTQALVEATLPIERNVFESDNPNTYFNFDEELKRREDRPNDPFVITQEEYNDNETDFEQQTLTYYDGDDVLADSGDTPIDDKDKVVGFENLLRFGHGSGDPNVVYIRNNRLESDIEVVHSDGKFAKEVLGFDDELKHSSKREPRRFRDSDD